MSAFYVGQRVKLVRPKHRVNYGDEGTVFASAPFPDWVGVVWDVRKDAFNDYAPESALEPLIPPGLESLEEINALYEPSPEVVTVEKRA